MTIPARGRRRPQEPAEETTVSDEANTPGIDLIRWSFTINPERRAELQQHLLDLGLDVQVVGEDQFVVTWEEPDGEDVSDIIEEMWEVHGSPFEVTHEEFRRLNLSTYHPEDAEDEKAA
jgi:hypothetical protein